MMRSVPGLLCAIGLMSCLATGCSERTPAPLVEEETTITSDTPFVMRLNGDSQIYLHQRWVDLYSEQGTFRNYLRKQADRYRQACEEEGVAMILQNPTTTLNPLKEYLPTEVVIEVIPTTKAGSISHVKHVAHEFGFMKFRVQEMEPAVPQ